jgi:molybdopterin-guanine dinucleotide biosynthesis protein
MPQKFDHPPKKVLITGGSGSGKTTLAEKLMRAEKARWKFVYDHDGQYSSRFGVEAVSRSGDLDEAVARGGFVCYDPVEDFEDDFPKGLQFFCAYILAQSKQLRGRKLFYCDEIDLLTTTTTYPRELVALMQTGRRYEIDCVLIAGQPNKLHNCVRTQLTEVYTFIHTDEPAMKFLSDNGIEEETIRSLGSHGWAYRHLRTGEVKGSGGKKREIVDGKSPQATGDSPAGKVPA